MLQKVILVVLLHFSTSDASTYKKINKGYVSVPTGIPSSTKTIYLSENLLTNIGGDDFSGLTLLIFLDLQMNRITSVSANAFDDTKLETLYLSHNPITTIPTWTPLISILKYLYMQNCSITSATWNLNIQYTKLKELDLAFNNLNTVPDISHMSSLVKLYLSYCQISSSSALVNPRIEDLDLGFNNLQVAPDISQICLLLENLVLDDNKLTSLPNNYFEGCNNLKSIRMRENFLSSLQPLLAIGTSLKSLNIKKNRFSGPVSSTFFSGWPDLTRANMEFCNFTSFDSENLKYTPNLVTLDLRGNKLTHITDPHQWCQGDACTQMELRLEENQLKCDFNFCWLKGTITFPYTIDGCEGNDIANVDINNLNCDGKFSLELPTDIAVTVKKCGLS